MNKFNHDKLTNHKLIEILLNKEKYEKDAIYSAEQELKSRNLSNDEIDSIENSFTTRTNENRQRQQNIQAIKSNVQLKSQSFQESINPLIVKKNKAFGIKALGWLTILIGCWILFSNYIYLELSFDKAIPFSIVQINVIVKTILCLIGGPLFIKGNKVGWLITWCLYVLFVVEGIFLGFYMGVEGILSAIPTLIILGGGLWYLLQRHILRFFKITYTEVLLFSIITSLVAIGISTELVL